MNHTINHYTIQVKRDYSYRMLTVFVPLNAKIGNVLCPLVGVDKLIKDLRLRTCAENWTNTPGTHLRSDSQGYMRLEKRQEKPLRVLWERAWTELAYFGKQGDFLTWEYYWCLLFWWVEVKTQVISVIIYWTLHVCQGLPWWFNW